MDSSGQVVLVGVNLGERHRFLNNLVKESCAKAIIEFQNLPEDTPIDRIFKIDLANRQRNVDYILETLKDSDMLYVSRALKSYWLLEPEHCNVINPAYLETALFPEMTKPAVNKMKHWIQALLKDSERCQKFYEYYKSNFDESIKYLWYCPREFILGEFLNIIENITPKHLARLCEACPQVARMYFEGLQKNRKALSRYLDSDLDFFNSLKCVLKTDGDMYLDLVESYFNEYTHGRLSASITRHIVKNFRNKFLAKRELYTSQILNISTLALCLSPDECKDLILHLARAEYIDNWFSYRSVEPLIKRIAPDERASFKKLVFVDKTVGDKVKVWPYETPSPLKLVDLDDHIFNDQEHEYYEYDCEDFSFKRQLKKRKYLAYSGYSQMCAMPQKTMLDQLFSRYRFAGFAKTFSELSSRLQAASSLEERQNIMLVLVSKSGRVPAQVETLLKLLAERHKNEPSNLRAAIVRSLVKRGCFWRTADDVWNLMLDFAHGLGLDGLAGDPLCVEGLHAVILRHLINNTLPSTGLMDAYKKKFTTFKEYDLNVVETNAVKQNLPPLLIPDCPNEFLDTVAAYKLKVDTINDAVDVLAKAARDNPDLINRLFDNRIARRQLIAQTFPIKQFEASYINALRHDVSLLADGDSFAALASKEKTNHDHFLQSLRVYFGEVNGLAAKHLTALEEAFDSKAKMRLVRPIVMLSSNHIVLNRIHELDSKISKENSKLSAAFKVNAHKAKPPVDIDAIGWRILGAKAVANRVLICKEVSLEQYMKSCLQWRQTYGIGLRLALNTSFEVEAFRAVSAKKPKVALSAAASYFFVGSRTINPKIWEIVKTILINTDVTKLPRKTYKILTTGDVPKNIETDFWTTIYQVNMKFKREKAESALCRLENMLPRVDADVVTSFVEEFIKKDLTIDNLTNYNNLSICGIQPRTKAMRSNEAICMYMRILAKYLLLCYNEKEQSSKIENVLTPFFDRIDELWKGITDKSCLLECMDDFLRSLKYTEVFIDTQYISCLPMFEKIISRLHKIIPRKEYFDKYVKLHFTILYFKAIRHAIGQNSNILKDENKDNAMKVVGMLLGQYIGSEIKELVSEFFVSIVEIYKEGLIDFLNRYFPYRDSRHKFISSVIKGLLKNSNLEAHLVAEHIFHKECDRGWEDYEEMLNTLEKSEFQEVKFFLHADVYTNNWY